MNIITENHKEKTELVNKLADIALKSGIQLFSCCNDYLLSHKIKKARCIDANLLHELFGIDISSFNVSPSRKECGCYKSIDLGVYDTCLHGCIYCYANNQEARIKNNYELHDPDYPALHKGIRLKEHAWNGKDEEYRQLSIED